MHRFLKKKDWALARRKGFILSVIFTTTYLIVLSGYRAVSAENIVNYGLLPKTLNMTLPELMRNAGEGLELTTKTKLSALLLYFVGKIREWDVIVLYLAPLTG